jgi:hypothetical protein
MAVFLTLLDDNGNHLWLADSVATEVSAFWGVMMYVLVDKCQCFGGNFCPHLQGRTVFFLTHSA